MTSLALLPYHHLNPNNSPPPPPGAQTFHFFDVGPYSATAAPTTQMSMGKVEFRCGEGRCYWLLLMLVLGWRG